MSDFQIELGDGRSIVVDAPDAQQAAASARMYLSREKGTKDAGKSTSDNMAQAFGSGALANFGDEATAAVRAAAPGLSNWMMRGPALQRDESIGGPNPAPQTVSTAPTLQGRYDEELARERGKAKEFQRTDPTLAAGSNIAGSLATTALALPAGLTAVGPNALVNVAKNAAVGAGIGGLSGLGEGEGTEDRLQKGALGTAFGAGAGALVRPLAAVGRSVAEMTPVRQAITDPLLRAAALLRGETPSAAPAVEGGALQRMASTVQQDRLTPQVAQQRLAQLGPEATLSDVSPSLLQQGVNMKTLGGETRQRAQDLFDPFMGVGRDARTGQRMIAAAEGNAPPPSHFQLAGEGQGFDQNARAVGQEAYGAMGGDKLKISAEMQQIMQRAPAIGETLAGVQAQYAKLGESLSPIELMDKVKQQLNRDATAAFQGGTGVDKAAVGKLADDFEAAFWRANPGAQKAAQVYAEAKSLPKHYTAGSSIFSKGTGEKATAGSAPALEDLLQGANPQQIAAQRAGAINAVRARAGTQGGALTMAQDIKTGVTPGGVQDALRTVMPDEAQALINRGSAERIFANTSRRYLGGPHTADDLAGSLGLGNNVSIRGTGKEIFPRFQEGLKAAVNWVAAPNEAVRNEIGRHLLDANPETQKRTLELIAQILQQRAAGNPVSAALAGNAGAQVGRAF